MSEQIIIEIHNSIGLIGICNPPVNAASHAVRQAIYDAVTAMDQDASVKTIVIYGTGRTFIAGADIKEFGQPPKIPTLGDVCDLIENCNTPVISILHGTALGGGLELALATHARIGIDGLKVGFPEVTLGIIPGAGGTQRAPRLTGLENALDIITSGKHIPASKALEIGLIDRLVSGDPREVAIEIAELVISGNIKTRKTGNLSINEDVALVDQWRGKMHQKAPLLFSPHKCVDAIAKSHLDIKIGLKEERKLFNDCMQSPQRSGLIHAFFAERAVKKIPEKDAIPMDLKSIGIVGGGTMGSGIATSVLLAGFPVILVEQNKDAANKTKKTISTNLEGAVKRKKLTSEDYKLILSEKFTCTTEINALIETDLIIEAVFEEMSVKKQIFKKLDEISKPNAIFASNTSYLDINELASVTSKPQNVIGLHFFSPAHIMKLLEVVVAEKTAPEVVKSGFMLAKKLKKVPVRARVCDGFIGNRILAHYRKVADYMNLDGASFEQIDTALEEFGFAMGPFAVSDLAGLDIGWATRKRQAKFRNPQERDVQIAERICENGWFGRKTERGYYIYDGEKRKPNPDVIEIISSERKKAEISPRVFTNEEIVERYMAAMISEAARVLEDGIALRPIDIDATFLFGYGFPRFRGGPLHYADYLGITRILEQISRFSEEDSFYWQTPALMKKMASDGTTFADLNC